LAPSRIALLQAMPIFGALRDDALELMLESAPDVARTAGEFYFREGEDAQSMFVIEQGSVEVLKRWDGRDQPLHRLRAGDCFGEMALMDFFPRSASVRALEPTRAVEIAPAALQRLAERDLEQFALLQMNMGREVCRRLRTTDEMLFRWQRRGGTPRGEDFGPTLI
jgi:CRP/FNR family transcriptional regulator, cyclic AMP receptor protein